MIRNEAPRWSPATRIAFRFVFSYFALYFPASYAFDLIPGGELLARKYLDLWDAVVVLAGEDLLHLEVLFEVRGIGNTAYGWALFLCCLALAAVVTVIWSVLDRSRVRYERLHQGLRLLLRYMLAAAMISYGAIKVIPLQMTAPPPIGVLSSRIGDLIPNHLLWWTIGASPPFESFIGLTELLGGLLLLVPRTTLLGALICGASSLTIFALNMCYDVTVKLPSLHLLAISAVLIAPDLRRLAGVFLFNRKVEPARATPLFERKWLDRVPHAILALFCLYVLIVKFDSTAEAYARRHRPHPPLFGYWSVEEIAVDGREVPLFTEPGRWRWVSFLRPGMLGVELMIGSARSYRLDLDMERKTMKLDQNTFSFDQPETGVLILNGHLDGHSTRAILRRMPLIREVPPPYKD